MSATLVDTNVLIDVSADVGVWREWSRRSLAENLENGLVINPIILAEFSVVFASPEEVETSLLAAPFTRENLPWSAAFLAGKAFSDYRSRGGIRTSPLPDFFIGAHAQCSGYRLLTRDAARYRTYFPDVELITPQTHP